MCVCAHTSVCAWAHACVGACMYTRGLVNVVACAGMWEGARACVRVCVHQCVHMRVRARVREYAHACGCACTWVHMSVCAHGCM